MRRGACDWCGEVLPVLTVAQWDEDAATVDVCQRCLQMAHDAAAKGVDIWEAARGFVDGPRWSEMDGAITMTVKYQPGDGHGRMRD